MELVYSTNIGCSSQVHLPLQRNINHFLGGLSHHLFNTCVHNILLSRSLQKLFLADAQPCGLIDDVQKVILGLFLPFAGHTSWVHMLQVLQPFEITDCHSTSIAKHIRQKPDSFGQANLFTLNSGWSICSLNHNFALEPVGVVPVDGHLKSSWDEYVAEQGKCYQGLQMASSFSKYSTPGKPFTPLFFAIQALRAQQSIPYGLQMLPSCSATPTNLDPSSVKYLLAQQPTFPNPWMIKVFPCKPTVTLSLLAMVLLLSNCFAQVNTPNPVDSVLPLIPNWLRYLPVVTASELISLCPQQA